MRRETCYVLRDGRDATVDKRFGRKKREGEEQQR
jgi:hypothetical protein